ncbi:MAG: hypothetical protein AAGB51_14760 [Planctomycetota bacterium]
MQLTRRLTLTLLLAVALPWAVLMTVGGLWLLMPGAAPAVLGDMPRAVLGVTAVAAGQLVFMCLVADRIFPGAERRTVWWIECFTCVVLFGGFAWLILLAFGWLAF